ncbi:MAG: hypothetical protein N2449_00050 [Bacteroidales bacterium]|nr:hypothetical protein [Bacteroidales bacterium]
MMTKLTHIIVTIVYCLAFLHSSSQVLNVQAELNRNKCLIGDHLTLSLTLSKPLHSTISFPVLTDTITKSIEIIQKQNIDTITKENQQITLKQNFIITSFDTGLITIPPLPFVLKNDSITDTIYTNPITFSVYALPVDTTKQTIFDIKPPIGEPFSWKEFLPYILWSLLAILIIATAIYVYLRIKKNKPIIPIPEKPKDPPYVVALKQLHELKEKKLWQKQLYKQYYSELTDILRIYLEEQYQIPAMESLSSELIEHLKNRSFDEELVRNMQSLLTTADFVKFAKATPLPDENDWHWKNAVAFVEQTKPVMEEKNSESKGGEHD